MIQEQEREFESTHHPEPSLWQQNYGSLLTALVAVILLAGIIVLVYRQNRFVPVRFPDGSSIDNPDSEEKPLVADSTQIAIAVSGSISSYGSVKLSIYEKESEFLSFGPTSMSSSASIVDGIAVWIVPVKSLPENFAVLAFHDENNDEQLNVNRRGIATERFGFTQNGPSLTWPPKFADAVIPRPEAGTTLEIFIR